MYHRAARYFDFKHCTLIGLSLLLFKCGSAQIKTIPDATQSINIVLKDNSTKEWERIELALQDENPPPERSVKLFLIKKLADSQSPKAENLLWKFAQAVDEKLRAAAWTSLKKHQQSSPNFEGTGIKVMSKNLQSFGNLLSQELDFLVNFRSPSAIQLKGQALRRIPDKSVIVLNSLVEDISLDKQKKEIDSPKKPFIGLSLAENEIWNFIRENPESAITQDSLQAIRQAWGAEGNQHIYNVSRQGGFNEPSLKSINNFLKQWLTQNDRKSLATNISRQIIKIDKSETLKIKALNNELSFLGYNKPLSVKSKDPVNIGRAFNQADQTVSPSTRGINSKRNIEDSKSIPITKKKNLKDLNGVEALDSFLERETGINLAGSRMHEHLLRMVNKKNFDKMPESRLLFSAIKNQGSGLDFFAMNKSLKKGFYNRGLLSSLLKVLDSSQRTNNWKLMALRQLTGLNFAETKKVWQIWQRKKSRLLRANL